MLFDVMGASSWLNEETRSDIMVHPLLSGSDMSIQSSNRRSILIFISVGLFLAVAVKMVIGDLISIICQSIYCEVRVLFGTHKAFSEGPSNANADLSAPSDIKNSQRSTLLSASARAANWWVG
jgi:hypothetical protein